ncbi:dihydrolipoamide acetyltransferase family protein [Blattabacterium cuenoti]|uniref:dihydrolipoamide acetyltransferase family protein n=1 Tax=Blattabacterium cuenoti TaxID=1653831 RepID=UPI00163C8224|nr:dihydrolipoamide acetyltransferase family protein [Blattabacterium cuenoti]
MAEIISMPQLSDTMEEGTVIKWNKKIGEKVVEGDIIAEIETDKAIQDFEIDVSGILLFIGVKEGEKTKVNDIIAIIGEEGEDINHLIKQKNLKNNLQEEKKDNERKFISPAARRLIKKMNVPIETFKNGSGSHGRIIKKDIETLKNENNINKIIHSSMRKKIAKHLSKSKISAPHYYIFSEINVDKLIKLREKFNDKLSIDERISFNDIIIKAVAQSLKKFPKMNVSWNDEYILFHKNINIGIAVAVEDGLIVPVIKNVDHKSVLQISKEIKEKVLRSKEKKIQINELEDSTFTVSNLGMYDTDSFTSIINIPNSSIISVGSIVRRPVVIGSKIEIGSIMKITLSCDHRIIDGALGSLYIRLLKKYLEDPFIIFL